VNRFETCSITLNIGNENHTCAYALHSKDASEIIDTIVRSIETDIAFLRSINSRGNITRTAADRAYGDSRGKLEILAALSPHDYESLPVVYLKTAIDQAHDQAITILKNRIS
jgi:hypothetical protein